MSKLISEPLLTSNYASENPLVENNLVSVMDEHAESQISWMKSCLRGSVLFTAILLAQFSQAEFHWSGDGQHYEGNIVAVDCDQGVASVAIETNHYQDSYLHACQEISKYCGFDTALKPVVSYSAMKSPKRCSVSAGDVTSSFELLAVCEGVACFSDLLGGEVAD